VGGFFEDWFEDWGTVGSYYEVNTTFCAYDDGWRRVTGWGGELMVFVVEQITPAMPGCSFGPSHNWFFVEASAFGLESGDPLTLPHEIGHACGLIFPNMGHHPSPDNLMFAGGSRTAATLNRFQRAVVRNSKHCTVI
jgi:hypothetical protein